MDKKDKIMVVLSIVFLLASLAIVIFGGGNKLHKVFANWDDDTSTGVSKEFSEDWIATEIVGHAHGMAGVSVNFARLKENQVWNRFYTDTNVKRTFTTWMAKGMIDDYTKHILAAYPGRGITVSSVDPKDGSVTVDWGTYTGATDTGATHRLYTDYSFEVTKWRVYGHVHP